MVFHGKLGRTLGASVLFISLLYRFFSIWSKKFIQRIENWNRRPPEVFYKMIDSAIPRMNMSSLSQVWTWDVEWATSFVVGVTAPELPSVMKCFLHGFGDSVAVRSNQREDVAWNTKQGVTCLSRSIGNIQFPSSCSFLSSIYLTGKYKQGQCAEKQANHYSTCSGL